MPTLAPPTLLSCGRHLHGILSALLKSPTEWQLEGEEWVCWDHPLCPGPRTVPVVIMDEPFCPFFTCFPLQGTPSAPSSH